MLGGNQRRTESINSSKAPPPPPPRPTPMISNAPAFYDPDHVSPGRVEPDYQQWLQAHAQANLHPGPYNVPSSSFHPYSQSSVIHTDHSASHQSRQQHQQPPAIQTQIPLHNQFSFLPGQFSQTPHYSGVSSRVQQTSSGYPQHSVESVQENEPVYYAPENIPSQQPVHQHGQGSIYQYPLIQNQFLGPTDPSRTSSSSSSDYPGFSNAPSLSPISDIPQGSSPAYVPTSLPNTNVNTTAAVTSTGKRPDRSALSNTGKVKKNRGTKRHKPSEESESDSDDESPTVNVQHMSFQVTSHPGRSDQNGPTRLPGACTHCKRLKMKCEFPRNRGIESPNICRRCQSGGHHCVVEGRKARSVPNKREYLLAQLRQKDAVIESLLKQLHNPYLATPMSIAAYKSSTSPSDQNNQNVIAWLERLTASQYGSVKAAGGTIGSKAFEFESRKQTQADESDSDADGVTTVRGADTLDTEDASAESEKRTKSGSFNESDKTSALPDAAVPLGLIAALSLNNPRKPRRSRMADDVDDEDDFGIANDRYFNAGPATDLGIRASIIEQHAPPEILVHGLVNEQDVDKLFRIFYDHLNPHVSLLDPVLHTPATVFSRCPFLFTVVCAVASRFYTEKSEIYPIAMHFAKHAAANALIDGWKSIELCQAYILLSTYAVPAKRWEEDRSWLYIGLAIRIATDLNLYLPPTKKPANQLEEREALNKTRVWLICYNLDRSSATQFGKPPTIKDDYITRHSADWYKKSKYNMSLDAALCGYTNLLRILAKFHDELFSDPNSPNGLNKSIDFHAITQTHDENLVRFHSDWKRRLDEGNTGEPAYIFRVSLLPYLVNYSRLVMHSFGFQHTIENGVQQNDGFFLKKCFEAAQTVIQIMVESLAPSGYMRFSPDGHFVFASFASAFLLKLLRPEFAGSLTAENENRIFDLISRLIQTLSSSDVAIDDRHTPKLHARFLAALLSKYQQDFIASGRGRRRTPPPSETVSHGPYGPMHPSGASSQVFSIAPPQPGSSSTSSAPPENTGQSFKFSNSASVQPTDIPDGTATAYQETEGAYLNSNKIFNGEDSLMNGISDEETLATLQALKNPAWWTNMMMPGFLWPNDNYLTTQTYDNHRQSLNGLAMSNSTGGLEAYSMVEVPLSY